MQRYTKYPEKNIRYGIYKAKQIFINVPYLWMYARKHEFT